VLHDPATITFGNKGVTFVFLGPPQPVLSRRRKGAILLLWVAAVIVLGLVTVHQVHELISKHYSQHDQVDELISKYNLTKSAQNVEDKYFS
jgi:hypothetical protein